jgi:hypothetical protein
MATATLEERVAVLEQKVAKFIPNESETESKTPWWKKIVGVYKDDPEFMEAERLGREYRESLRPHEDAAP